MKMKRLPDAEFSVMRAVWESDIPSSTAEIKTKLDEEKIWNMSALQTVLSRLEEKGFLRSEKNGRNRFYTPLVAEEEYLADESRSFLERIGGKDLTSLVAAMYENKNISDEELENLRKFIDSKRKGGN